MAVVTSDYLAGVLTQFRALYESDFQAALAVQGWRDISVFMPSNGAENTYTWFGTVPLMEDVTHGQVSRRGLSRYNFTIQNNEYQAVLEVERAVLERDNLGLIRPRIEQLGSEAAMHPGRLILSLLNTNPLAFDGVAFFSDSRVIGASASIDNIVTGTGVASVATIQADLNSARGAMRLFQDDTGRPMNLVGNTIVIPPQIEQIFWQALNADQSALQDRQVIPAGNGNWSARGYMVVVDPYLTDANDWYLLHNGGPSNKPFIFQQEVAPGMNGTTNPNESTVIESRKFLYSVYGRYNVGVTDPRFGVKVTNV